MVSETRHFRKNISHLCKVTPKETQEHPCLHKAIFWGKQFLTGSHIPPLEKQTSSTQSRADREGVRPGFAQDGTLPCPDFLSGILVTIFRRHNQDPNLNLKPTGILGGG